MNIRTTSLTLFTSAFVMACAVDKTNTAQTTPQPTKEIQPLVMEEAAVVDIAHVSQPRISAQKKMMQFDMARSLPATSNNAPFVPQVPNNDKFAEIDANGITLVKEQPVSTFSVDVDTGSYAVVRKYLNQGQLPPSNAVRSEELINYFEYQYQQPDEHSAPFSVNTLITATPWNEQTQLVQVGLQGFLPKTKRSDANLVFLLDVSGSMNAPDKLPLLKNAFKLLTKQLTKNDRVSIVVYAGASGVVLKPTAGDQRSDIIQAINELRAGGSTNGASGIQLAYQLAEDSFIEDGINRVILATDGDFNVGTVNHDALIDLIKRKKDKGIALTTLGFGSGNYNDHLMEQLADHGDGNYAYIDNLSEARKTLVGQISATLETIAKDVKIQIEWNPSQVAEYRLIGYENRLLKREDFNNDKVDAGEIGAGHSVTALYEVRLKESPYRSIDELRYQKKPSMIKPKHSNELAFVKLRYKKPNQGSKAKSILLSHPIQLDNSVNDLNELKFAASVAAFAQKLRGGKHLNEYGYADILKLAQDSKGKDNHGYRGEFLKLIKLAQSLSS